MEAIVEGTGVIEPLKDRIVGRIAAEELVNKGNWRSYRSS